VKHKTTGDLTAGLRKLTRASLPLQNLERHWGVIQGLNADGTVALTIAGSDVAVNGVKTVSSYLPVAGDTVLLDVVGSDLTVAGSLGTAPAQGILPGGYAQVTAVQGPSAPPFDITGAARTVTIAANRYIRIVGEAGASSSVTTDTIQLGIYEGGTLIQGRNAVASAAGATALHAERILTTRAGTPDSIPAGVHTFHLTLALAAGSGNLTSGAGSGFPTLIYVEDVGSAVP
jgi:hypothetical protein